MSGPFPFRQFEAFVDFLHNIAVVGAGMAGLAAARALQQAGRNVQIFDKGRRPGGRMSSRRNAHGLFDLGAQYFTVRDPDFAKVIAHCEKLGVVAQWPNIMARHVDGQWQSQRPEHPRYSGVPSMAALIDALAESLDIHQQVRITSMTRTDSIWTLEDQNGRLWPGFDHVILAIPAPQATLLLDEVATSLLPLPDMSSCWSTWVRFEDTLAMPEGIDAWQGVFLETSPVLRWAARNQTRPGQHEGERITLLASDDWSDRHLEADPARVADDMIEAFRNAYPAPLPAIRARGAHRWRYAQPRQPTEDTAGYLVGMAKGLSLCGDWCIDGRVEAAWQSGNRLAQALCHP
ncbi:NAD(P)/FAD-dependent oxidoreductase [Kushneria sp. Sum13]|uniref:NAD(P)/FAD-dependent oxidoreductase n=1 Tax=Kushneria sp. Sum13 TaxID=3459196 RepID=UPI004045B7F1